MYLTKYKKRMIVPNKILFASMLFLMGIYLISAFNFEDPNDAFNFAGDLTGNVTVYVNNGSFIEPSEEPNLNVNSSIYSNETIWWANLFGWVEGWFVNNAGQLDLNETKLNKTVVDVVNVTFDDIWVNEDGDTMTGNLVMDNSNISLENDSYITGENSSSSITIQNGGDVIIRLGQ